MKRETNSFALLTIALLIVTVLCSAVVEATSDAWQDIETVSNDTVVYTENFEQMSGVIQVASSAINTSTLVKTINREVSAEKQRQFINSNLVDMVAGIGEEGLHEEDKLINQELIDVAEVKVKVAAQKQEAAVAKLRLADANNVETVKISGVAQDSANEIIMESAVAVIISDVDQSDALLEIEEPDENYNGVIIELDAKDRDLLEHLVMGEAGSEGYEGACLVAQAIRDALVYKGFKSVAEVRKGMKYSGSIKKEPNEDVLNACKFIFDEGGCVVKHRILYFYAPKYCSGKWHNTQHFIIEHGGHRFFDSNND